MAYKDVLKNSIKTFEDLENWLTRQKARVDPRLRDVIARIINQEQIFCISDPERINLQ
jgi:hypothetical protein